MSTLTTNCRPRTHLAPIPNLNLIPNPNPNLNPIPTLPLSNPNPILFLRFKPQLIRGLFLLLLSSLAGPVFTGTELLGDTVTNFPTADTTLFEFYPDNNLGASDLTSGSIQSGERSRTLMKFGGLSSLPSQATVTAVTLILTLTRQPDGGPNSTFHLHRLLQPWNEGNKAGTHGDAADPGETTWNERLARQTGGSWSAPGAVAPDDFSLRSSASLLLGGAGRHTFASTSNLVADVQFWLQHPTSNHGWILTSDSEDLGQTVKHFASREDAPIAPALVIEYTAPAVVSSPILERPCLNGDQFILAFTAQPQRTYTVQFLTSLAGANWQTLTNIAPQPQSVPLTILEPLSAPQRFYRVTSP